MKIVRQRKPEMRMEMSPLIDCIFQLLIFFMLSSTFLTPSIRLTLPTAEAGGPPQGQQIIHAAIAQPLPGGFEALIETYLLTSSICSINIVVIKF